MWQDINSKTGYKNMQGQEYLYGNMKLLNTDELADAIADGISEWVKTPPAPESPWKILERVKKAKINMVKGLFTVEISKPVAVGTNKYKGGYTTLDRIDGARRLVELKAGNQIQLYDVDDKPVLLNPAQVKALVVTLGDTYQNLFAIRQELIVNIREAGSLTAVEDIIIPWEITIDNNINNN